MLYVKAFRIHLSALPFLVLARILLKTLAVDVDTGFYGGGPWGTLFALALFCVCLAVLWQIQRTPDSGIQALRGNRVMECLAALLGAALFFTSAVSILPALGAPGLAVPNSFPNWLKIIEHLLGCLSGAAFAALAFVLWSGARANAAHGVMALVPAAWHAFYMVDRFISFRQPLFASDQLLEILYLCCATMFYLAHARCLSGTAPSRKAALCWALLTAVFGPVLALGQLAALAVLGPVSGPPGASLPLTLATSFYALSVAICVSGARQKEEPDNSLPPTP